MSNFVIQKTRTHTWGKNLRWNILFLFFFLLKEWGRPNTFFLLLFILLRRIFSWYFFSRRTLQKKNIKYQLIINIGTSIRNRINIRPNDNVTSLLLENVLWWASDWSSLYVFSPEKNSWLRKYTSLVSVNVDRLGKLGKK